MRYKATKDVHLGGGQYLTEGQTVELQSGLHIPGLEPVLEKVPGGLTMEHQGGRNLDAPGRGKAIRG